VTIASDPADAGRARQVAEMGVDNAPRLWWTAGLHPHEASQWSAPTRRDLETALDRGAVAVGETGLDHHYLNSTAAQQARAFTDQLAIAIERDLPIVVHSREAESETLGILAETGVTPERVVLHCFTGSAAMLEEAVARAYYVSFSGIVSFPKFPATELVTRVSDERLLIETDAPYLAPVPHRGRRNEPAFLVATLEAVARARSVAPEAVAEITRTNALRFYRLDVSALDG
jgi:TatD DNase family protein